MDDETRAKPRTFHKDAGQSPTTLSYGWPGSCLHAYTVSLQGAFTLTQAATPVRVPADGVMDGMHHWGNRSFDCEQQRLLKSCRQHMQEERSELLTRVKAREERVSATISHCQRKSELELERRLALLAAQEKSAKEAVRQREQIEQQAQEIRRLQQQLRRSDSEPKLKDVSDMKWRRQAGDRAARELYKQIAYLTF
eukprot:g22996.t1